MKPVITGLAGGIILSVAGWLSLNLSLFAAECNNGMPNHFFTGLGLLLLFPAVLVGYLSDASGITVPAMAEVTLMIIAQLAGYTALVFLVTRRMKRAHSGGAACSLPHEDGEGASVSERTKQ